MLLVVLFYLCCFKVDYFLCCFKYLEAADAAFAILLF